MPHCPDALKPDGAGQSEEALHGVAHGMVPGAPVKLYRDRSVSVARQNSRAGLAYGVVLAGRGGGGDGLGYVHQPLLHVMPGPQ